MTSDITEEELNIHAIVTGINNEVPRTAGLCRIKSPSISGWPKVDGDDFCGEFEPE